MSLSKNTRILTDLGICRLKDVKKGSKVWDGSQYKDIEIEDAGKSPEYKVYLSNGQCLACSDDFPWETESGTILSTNCLRPGDSIILDNPKNKPWLSSDNSRDSLSSSHEESDDSTKLSIPNVIKKVAKTSKIPARLYTADHSKILEFVEKWLDANNGHIMGTPTFIDDFQKLLHVVGINKTSIEKFDNHCRLNIDVQEKSKIPKSQDSPRLFSKVSESVFVEAIELSKKRQHQFKIAEGAITPLLVCSATF